MAGEMALISDMGIPAVLKEIAGQSLESDDQVQVAEDLAADSYKSEVEVRQITVSTPGNAFPFGSWIVEEAWRGEMRQAKKVYSRLLRQELWLILDSSFEPPNGLARYFPEEIPLLWDKTPRELKNIQTVKSVFHGASVVQEE